MVVNCKEIAQRWKDCVKERVSAISGDRPKLTVIQVGSNPASCSYIKGKMKDCAEVSIICEHIHITEQQRDIYNTEAVLEIIDRLNADRSCSGIIVQLPLPEGFDTEKISNRIARQKDVDGFRQDSCFLPCTPGGIIAMLDELSVMISGVNAVVVGRSNIVGKPLARMLLERDATVTVCHSRTRDVSLYTRNADILISAVGKKGIISADMVKTGATVIDVGINRDENGKLCGDVLFDEVCSKAGIITPVPGGVGLLTRAFLIRNVLDAYLNQSRALMSLRE